MTSAVTAHSSPCGRLLRYIWNIQALLYTARTRCGYLFKTLGCLSWVIAICMQFGESCCDFWLQRYQVSPGMPTATESCKSLSSFIGTLGALRFLAKLLLLLFFGLWLGSNSPFFFCTSQVCLWINCSIKRSLSGVLIRKHGSRTASYEATGSFLWMLNSRLCSPAYIWQHSLGHHVMILRLSMKQKLASWLERLWVVRHTVS